MYRLINAVKGALSSSGEKKEPETYQSWISQLNKCILAPLLPVFCALRDEGSVAGETRKGLLKQLSETLEATESILQQQTCIPDSVGDGESSDVTAAKQVLLEIWYHLLGSLAPVPTPNVNPIILRAIVIIVHRPEFSMAAFISVNNGASCPPHELSLAQRYRTLLCGTFRYVASVLSLSAIPKDECLSPISPFFFKINGLLYPCINPYSPVISPGSPPASIAASLSSLPGAEQFSLDSASAGDGAADDLSPTFEQVAVPDESHPQVLGLSLIEETRSSIRSGGSDESGDQSSAYSADSSFPTYSELTFPFQVFAAQILAVVYWRIPSLQSDILAAATKKTELATASVVLPESAPFMDPTECPLLLQWGKWHRTLKTLIGKDDGESERIRAVSKRWLWHISRHHAEFFVEFFLEWIQFTRKALGEETDSDISEQKINWRRIPGYTDLTRAFLSVFANITFDKFPAKEMERAELALLTTIPPVIMNAYTKLLYRRTRLAEIPSLVNAVLTIDSWLAELHAKHLTIGDEFDMEYFCKGLDYILQTDQHLVLSRLLAMIYNYSDVFVGKNRLELFGHLLLEQHFFHLFCHWDTNVRLIYNQVLLFTMTRTRQCELFPVDAKNVPNRSKSFYKKDAWSTESIDTLLYVKIEAYVKTVTDYVAERRQAALAARNPPRRSFSRIFTSGRKSMSLENREKPAAPIKKKYIIEEARIPIIEEENAPVLPPSPLLATPPPPPCTPEPSLSPLAIELPLSPDPADEGTTTTTTTTALSPSSAAAAAGFPPITPRGGAVLPHREVPEQEIQLMEPTEVIPAGAMPQHLKIYAVRACEDYLRHLSRYKEWESRNFSQVPRLLTMV